MDAGQVSEIDHPALLSKERQLTARAIRLQVATGPQNPMISYPNYPIVKIPDIEEIGQKIKGRKISILYFSAFDLSAHLRKLETRNNGIEFCKLLVELVIPLESILMELVRACHRVGS